MMEEVNGSTKWQLIEFVQAIYEAPTYHILLEAVLFLWVLWLMFHKSYKPKKDDLTEKVRGPLNELKKINILFDFFTGKRTVN